MNTTFYGKQKPDVREEGLSQGGAPVTESPAGENTEAPVEGKKKQRVVDEQTVQTGIGILKKYRDGKTNLENRIVNDELWWELRHWEAIGSDKARRVEPTSAWLFNSIMNKHSDATDNYPEPVVLPRERSDEDSAKILTSVLPVILENNNFEDTYSENWWEKLKHGTAAYGIFWNPDLQNGLGDIEIKPIDLLSIYWEPGIKDIQASRNLFITDLVDNDIIEQEYPETKGNLGSGGALDAKQYIHDDNIDISDKSIVVDWYYHVEHNGRRLLHMIKFCGSQLLFASENEPEYRENGFYKHGLYPVVFDRLFPEKDTPVGFGYVAICKDPQIFIDKLSGNILETAMMATKKRFFASNSTNINEREFLDWTKPIVHVEGDISDARIKEIALQPLSGIYTSILQMKIEEMKETSANRDVNSGGTTGSVSAAAAISALQEAGNRTSRDMISASYRSYRLIIQMVIELIREFYDVSRSFRITGEQPGEYKFVDVSNARLNDQLTLRSYDGQEFYRKPIFDLKIKAQKRNPFSRMEMNERAKELYRLGFFAPEKAQEALGALEMMDFEGIDKVREGVQQGQTLLAVVQDLQGKVQELMGVISHLTGQAPMGAPALPEGPAEISRPAPSGSGVPGPGRTEAAEIMKAHTPMTSYGDALAKRSAPDMDIGNQMNAGTGV